MPRTIEQPIVNQLVLWVMDKYGLIEIKQVADFLDVNLTTVHKWAHRARIALTAEMTVKVAARLNISADDVIAMAMGMQQAS